MSSPASPAAAATIRPFAPEPDPAAADAARLADARTRGVTGRDGLIRVFVYGTLLRGQGNARFLRESRFLRPAVTANPYRMWCIGFPLIQLPQHEAKPDPLAARVVGELYAVTPDVLRRLDGLEAEGSMYDRRAIAVRPADPACLAYAYLWRGRPSGEAVPVPETGLHDWRGWRRT